MKLLSIKIKFWYLLTLVATVLWSAISVLVPLISGRFINAVTTDPHNISGIYFWLFLVCSVLQATFSAISTFLSLDLVKRVKNFFRINVVRSLFAHRKYQEKSLSSAITDINVSSSTIAEQYVKGEIDIVNCISMIILSSVGLFTINKTLSVVIIIISIIIVVFPKVFSKKSQKNREDQINAQDILNKRTTSFVKGIETLYNFGARGYFKRLLLKDNSAILSTEGKANNFKTVTYTVNAFLQITKTFVIIGLGAYLITKNQLSIGGLLAAIQIAATLGAPMEVLSMLLYSRREVEPIAKRVQAYTTEPTTEAKVIMDSIVTVNFNHYGQKIDGKEVLHDLSLTFEKKKKYLIVGKSGSGKSTLLRAISGVTVGEQYGELAINGLSGKSFKQIKLVTQSPAIFQASLADNLFLGERVDNQRLQQMINFLELNNLTDRFDLMNDSISEEDLSGGERQRIALGRALLAKPDVLLLDEFSSALDPDLSLKLEKHLLELPCMIISVSHHVNRELFDQYDEVVEIANGVVISITNPA
ncbi:hypothetical protein FC15_GL000420 [Lapidilactobacillus concavus DSM 17758]|uniref:ABC transporter ATP-binding protein n=2 Tax=Lapidilactobacillus TaxID=2767884 RepID=A0A0R1W4H5_9LACO|nr:MULTISPECIES: ABC transporter ATP-binding protein [Lapidilactobacillus]KRM12437.1 hypothetical protein FC15_GL000420 [Lapidilactobacillus concavus DSM 17758]GEL13269.1 ABC transporter permease [Lapidilactobacillus concavus]